MAVFRPLILLLENDHASAEAMQLALRDWGADVVSGANDDDVTNAIGSRARLARMIIADFHLTTTDGVTAAKKLRKRAPGAQVLVVSGSLSNDARRAARRAGYAFMQKPTPPRNLFTWLTQAGTLAE